MTPTLISRREDYIIQCIIIHKSMHPSQVVDGGNWEVNVIFCTQSSLR